MSSVQPSYEAEGNLPNPWGFILALGILTTIVGVWLIFSTNASLTVLAILLAVALFFAAVSEFLFARDRKTPAVGYVLGVVFLIGALIVVIRPVSGLTALAVVFGIVLLVSGLFQFAAAIVDRDVVRHWVWMAIMGAITFIAGIVALVWPNITLFVLALILGIRVTIFGIMQIAVAMSLRQLNR